MAPHISSGWLALLLLLPALALAGCASETATPHVVSPTSMSLPEESRDFPTASATALPTASGLSSADVFDAQLADGLRWGDLPPNMEDVLAGYQGQSEDAEYSAQSVIRSDGQRAAIVFVIAARSTQGIPPDDYLSQVSRVPAAEITEAQVAGKTVELAAGVSGGYPQVGALWTEQNLTIMLLTTDETSAIHLARVVINAMSN